MFPIKVSRGEHKRHMNQLRKRHIQVQEEISMLVLSEIFNVPVPVTTASRRTSIKKRKQTEHPEMMLERKRY